MMPKTLGNGRQKAYFLNGRRIALDEVIPSHAEASDKGEIIGLHVFDPSPSQIGGVHAGEPRKIALVDQCSLDTLARKRRGGDCTIDAPADDQYVIGGPCKLFDVTLS